MCVLEDYLFFQSVSSRFCYTAPYCDVFTLTSFLRFYKAVTHIFKPQEFGIDLGTTTVRLYVRGKGVVLREPSVVALAKETGEVQAVGEDAYRLLGRSPGSVVTVRPLKDGVIADYALTEAMLKAFLRRLSSGPGRFLGRSVIMCVPSGATETEKRAVLEVVREAGAKRALLLDQPLAAAIGAGLDVTEPTGAAVVNVGGGTTDIAVISLGGVVVAESLRVAGNAFDEAIVRFIRHKENLLIGDRTAEEAKLRVGAATSGGPGESSFEVRGRDITSSLPKNVVVTTADVVEALQGSLEKIADGVQRVLEAAPPELVSDVIERGIVLTGGGVLLRNFDVLLQQTTGIPVVVAENAADCVALGTGRAFSLTEQLDTSEHAS